MMAFYTKPPHGKMSLNNLHVYTENRLNFLGKISKCQEKFVAIKDVMEDENTVAMSDCLIEGSKKDQVSHFMLRLACSQSDEMTDFFVQSESALFYYRFSCMTRSELHSMIKPIKRFYRYICNEVHSEGNASLSNNTMEILNILDQITNEMTWEELIEEYIMGNSKRFIKISFQYVSNLIAKRLVQLESGLAFIPCQKLDAILKTVFELTLRHGMKVAAKRLFAVKQDIRIRRLNWKIKKLFEGIYPQFSSSDHKELVLSEEVDALQHYFPPCMNHLHNSLRGSHRLKHFSRIQYTLFLKELGLPVNEAVHFWQSEYSLPTKTTNNSPRFEENYTKRQKLGNCSHSWDTDGRRYTYSIRHLYGLEGSRKNYKGHCCTSLQNFDGGPGEQGGCPFKQFDQHHLKILLSSQGITEPIKSEICYSAEIASFNEACLKYMCSKLLKKHRTQFNFQEIENSQMSVSKTLQRNKFPKYMEDISNGKLRSSVAKTYNTGNSEHGKRQYKECINFNYIDSNDVHKYERNCDIKRRKIHKDDLMVDNNNDSSRCKTTRGTPMKSSFEKTNVETVNNNELNFSIEGCHVKTRAGSAYTANDEVDSTIVTQSCYEHNTCPSQKVCFSQRSSLSQTMSQCTSYSHKTCDEKLDNISAMLNNGSIFINKPLDYYQTYKVLVEGLLI